jgi:hypothetical protein
MITTTRARTIVVSVVQQNVLYISSSLGCIHSLWSLWLGLMSDKYSHVSKGKIKGKTFWHLHKVKPVLSIGYLIPGHSIWKRMHWGEAEMHSFSYTNDQVLYNQFSPYFLCRVSWLPIIINLGSLSQIRLNEYQLKSISFNYNICGIWKIFNNTRQRKYGLKWHIAVVPTDNMCGRSFSSDHSGYCVINRMINKNHVHMNSIFMKLCEMTNVT